MSGRDVQAVAERAVRVHGAAQQAPELAELLGLVQPGAVVVEIGCDAGGVLWAFREAGAGQIIGVDLPGGPYSSGRRLVDHGAAIVEGDSHEPRTLALLVKILDGRPVDLLFIDADHTYEGVKVDYEMYAPLVRPGGLVALHDICHHDRFRFPEVQVERLWWEITAKNPGRTREIVYHRRPWGSGMGIGVLTTPDHR